MDFGFYPPEINSGRMYSGPGSGPMLAAAQAWVALADELYTAASGYQSAVSELTSGAWSGPSSASMSDRGRVLCRMAQRDRRAGRGIRRPGARGRRRLRDGVRHDGAATGDRRQPQPAGGAGGYQLLRAEHAGDRGHRNRNTPKCGHRTPSRCTATRRPRRPRPHCHRSSSRSRTPIRRRQASQAAAVSQATDTTAGDAQSAVSSAQQAFSAVPQALQGLATSQSAATDPPPPTRWAR